MSEERVIDKDTFLFLFDKYEQEIENLLDDPHAFMDPSGEIGDLPIYVERMIKIGNDVGLKFWMHVHCSANITDFERDRLKRLLTKVEREDLITDAKS